MFLIPSAFSWNCALRISFRSHSFINRVVNGMPADNLAFVIHEKWRLELP